MRHALAAALVSLAVGVTSVADASPAAPAARPGAAPAAAAPAPAAAKPATCKRTFVGKGLERHAVCVFEPVVVAVDVPAPKVIIMHADPRNVVGRPRSENRLNGLPQTLH